MYSPDTVYHLDCGWLKHSKWHNVCFHPFRLLTRIRFDPTWNVFR